jgi:hypothetical protein
MSSLDARLSPRDADRRSRGYSAALRNGLIACAVLLALLPIPVTALRLLPVYRVHAGFLLFYAPLVCLLALAYLLYVRDLLGRFMFASILRPLPEFDPYAGSNTRDTLTRLFRGIQVTLLAVLPVALLAASFYCFTRYTGRLTESVELAALTWDRSLQVQEPPVPNTVPAQKPRGKARREAVGGSAQDSTIVPAPAPSRGEVLENAGIDNIPLFTELTALYIGIFATALMAVIMMALKENAKDAMGLSEQDLILGPPGDVEAVAEHL